MPYNCQYCGKVFGAKQQKDQHELIHENKRYTCELCEKPYSNLANLSRHIRNSHELKSDKSTTTSFSVCGPEFVCGECNKYFPESQAREYNQHLENHHKTADFGEVKYPMKK